MDCLAYEVYEFLVGFWGYLLFMYSKVDYLVSTYANDQLLRITIAFVPGLLSISYPLIIQTISRLNDQYKSTHIVDRFKSEPRHKWFFFSLVTSVFLTLICVVDFKGFFLLAFLSIINLLSAFFLNIRLLLKYQSGKELFTFYSKYLGIDDLGKFIGKQKASARKKIQILNAWHVMIDLYSFAIVNKDRKLQEDIRIFFILNSVSFIKYAEQKDQELVLFPTEFYNSTFDIIATYIRNKDDNYYQNIEFFVGSIFFTEGDEQKQFIHQNTYAAIWRNLYLLVENDRDDKILRYWGNAHQHCTYHFNTPRIEHDQNYNETDKSKELRLKIASHKKLFIQFHIVLCSYLMYKKKYKTLQEAWFYTQSQPADYVLVPQTMNEIFYYYFTFLEFGMFDTKFPLRYYFKDLEFDAMNNRSDVRTVVRKYCCLLFLKQWLTPNYYGQSRLILPQIPEDQSEKKIWEENLKYFRVIVNRHLKDKEILEELKLDWITVESCASKKIPHPLKYIDDLEQAVKDGFQQTLKELTLDPTLTKKLNDYAVLSIKQAYDKFSRISGKDVKAEERDEVSKTMEAIRGTRTILDKEAFVANSSTSYLDFHTIIGRMIKQKYYDHISLKFHTNTSLRYEVPNGQMFGAVDCLNLKPSEHSIIAFNVNIAYLQEASKISFQKGVNGIDYTYKAIPIYCFEHGLPSMHNTLFILRTQEFPMIKHRDWSTLNLNAESKEHWQNLQLIDENLRIYGRFTELDKNEILLAEYENSQGKNKDELRNMVEIEVDFLAYCWFKQGVKIVSIREANMFQEGGTKNKIDDVLAF